MPNLLAEQPPLRPTWLVVRRNSYRPDALYFIPFRPQGPAPIETNELMAGELLPRPKTGEGAGQRARNDRNAPPGPRCQSPLPGSAGVGKRSWSHACHSGASRVTVAAA